MASNDWTTGPAKWAAVAVLGGASIFGMAWSIATRGSAARAAAPDPPARVELNAERSATTGTERPASRLIDINTASDRELELLPGIGPSLAARIIQYRSENGPFKSVEDLDNVKGIGPRTLERLRPLVEVKPVSPGGAH